MKIRNSVCGAVVVLLLITIHLVASDTDIGWFITLAALGAASLATVYSIIRERKDGVRAVLLPALVLALVWFGLIWLEILVVFPPLHR